MYKYLFCTTAPPLIFRCNWYVMINNNLNEIILKTPSNREQMSSIQYIQLSRDNEKVKNYFPPNMKLYSVVLHMCALQKLFK